MIYRKRKKDLERRRKATATRTVTSKSKTAATNILLAAIIAIVVAASSVGVVGKEIVYAESSISNKAPDFSLQTIDGKQITSQSFIGKKPVILWFMSPSCPSCFAQADTLKKLTLQYADKIDLLLIDLLPDSSSDLQSFIANNGSPKWKATIDTDRVSIKYGITETDSTVILDSNGDIVFKHLGLSDYQQLKDAVAKLVV